MQPSRRQLLSRPMGNAQSRQTALGQSPQYGATTNPNGAQTASAYDPNRQPPAGISPQNPAWLASRREAARMNPRQPTPTELYEADPGSFGDPTPAPYAGGDVAGQAQYYRQTALQGYRPPGNSSQQGMIARSVQDANPNADFRSSQYSALNGYDGFTAAINDPNRLTPDQRFAIEQQSAQGAMN